MELAEHAAGLSETRRALLEKYLRGEMARPKTKPALIPRRNGDGTAPLSSSQQQIWLHSQLARSVAGEGGRDNGASLIYNEPITIHRRGELDVFALERSFTEMVWRHEAWRTTFHWEGERAVQIVHPAPTHIDIPFDDLRSHPHAEAEALRLATEDARRPFDLTRGPLYRLRLVRLRDDEHRLFITLHHIIFDGVSLYRVFLPELLVFYQALVEGRSPALAELPIQYSDYAWWQQQSLRHLPPEHFTYWREVLHDVPPLEVKPDHARATQTYAGAMERFEISGATTAALKRLSQEQNATLFMTMTAAFMTLLQNRTGQEDIVIGGITSGRNCDETMGLLGCFLNTIPIRCAFSKELPFTDVLARVRAATLGALSHDEVPFELLVQRFARNRDRAPLVQALIVVEPPLDPLPRGWGFTHMDVETGTAKFDLELGLDDRAEGFSGRFIYNSDLFDRATIKDLKTGWLALLDTIAVAPTRPLRALCGRAEARPSGGTDLRMSGARDEVMPPAEWNGWRTDYPRHSSIQEIFEKQARLTPSASALIFGETEWSYDRLNRTANRLARRLQKLGVGRDVPVGVLMERSPEMVMALLAVVKAGGAYVPLDPSYPAARLTFMVSDAQMPVILTHKNLGTGANWAKSLHVDNDSFAAEDDSNLATNPRARDLAYIMYTSGSTGTPKGAAIPHRGVVRLVKNADYVTFLPDETFLQLAPISFDASTFEIWGALLNGGRLIIMPPEFPTLKEIGRAIREHGVTTLLLTSGLFNAMVDEQLEDLGGLRQLLTGGDALSTTHAARVIYTQKSVRLINGYGPTESTTFACCHTVKVEDVSRSSIPIGKPIANTTAYILNEKLRPVPIGAPGELCIGGDGLARGYWMRDELTLEKFVMLGGRSSAMPHSGSCALTGSQSSPLQGFSGEADARLYKTGDLARWRDDGTIEFLGRADRQIKLRGFRIEPGEIEIVLKQEAGVRDCAVVLREDKPGETRLFAYIAGDAAPEELRNALQKSLPDYMVPAVIVPLPSLPRTPNGKLDRSALPAPDSIPQESSSETIRPYLGLQVQLIEIWRDLLGAREIGIRDNFFELGGNSLLALRLLHRAEVISGKAILPAVFFSNPTVEFLAAELARQASEESPLIVKVNDRGGGTPFFYLHGDLFGGGFYSSKLSRALGPEQPFYVLPPLDVRRGEVPSVEEMASAHWQTLRTVRPHGPYVIGGFCLGGIVAYELAQQIAASGEKVEMVLLIDASPRNKALQAMRALCELGGRWLKWDEEKQLNQFRRCWLRREQFALWRKEDGVAKIRLLLRQLRRILSLVWKKSRPETTDAEGAPPPTSLVKHRDVLATFLWAAAGYRARKYRGEMVALLSEDLLHRGDHLENAWSRLAPKVTVRSLKGSHLECITAHVDNLAQTIDGILTPTTAARFDAPPTAPALVN
jgi:amino acid adenylation domain-containing protein